MKKVEIVFFLAIFLAIGCAGPACHEVKRPNGQIVCAPDCTPIVQYQGTNFSIKGVNVPIPTTGTTVNIGDTAWNKSVLQSAATASQILDIQRVSRCEKIGVVISSFTDQKEYEKLMREIFEREEKINQLSLLIVLNNPEAVVNWINAYAIESSAASLGRTGDPHSEKAVQAVRALGHPIYAPKNVKTRSLDSLL